MKLVVPSARMLALLTGLGCVLSASALFALPALRVVVKQGLVPPSGIAARSTPDPVNSAYDGKFTFARLRYTIGSDGGMNRFGAGDGGPPWSHDYPRAETNLMQILNEISYLRPHTVGGNIVDVGSRELFRYPVAYMSEPGFWTMTDAEVANMRSYLLKGGFLIFDDFPDQAWQNFDFQMHRLIPDAQFVKLDVSHPIFHAFFDIETLDAVHSTYRGQPVFYGLFEDNDPSKRLMAIINFRNDIGEDWEYSQTGLLPVSSENEAFQFGVNYIFYGMTH